jgi:hypothetical protein
MRWEDDMIYELRVYEVAPGKLPALHDQFQQVTLKIFDRLGFRQAGFWTADVGTSNELIYLLAWESLAEREQKWAEFRASEWPQMQAKTEADGPFLLRIRSSILRPTPYSAVQ